MISKIPLTVDPNQTSQVTIPGNTKSLWLTLTLSYNTMANYWVLGIYDRATNNPYVLNIPLLPGYDLLQQFGYMGIGSCALSNIGDKTILVPNISNLGTDFALFWKYDD